MADLTISQHIHNGLMQSYSGIFGEEDKSLVLAIDPNNRRSFDADYNHYIKTLKSKNNEYIRFKEQKELGEDKVLIIMELLPKGKEIVDLVWEGKFSKLPEDYKKKHFCLECPTSAFKRQVVNNSAPYRKQWAKIWGLPNSFIVDETIEMESKPVGYKDIFGHPFDFKRMTTEIDDNEFISEK
jgi:hypothetical protein